jgi:hypothetical protein
MNEKHARRSLSLLAMILLFKASLWTTAPQAARRQDDWTPPVAAMRKTTKVASYRARLAGDTLLIEVTHEPGWHTYALDNLERAKKKAGEPPLGIEKSTQIEVSGGLRVVSKWRQSPPKDLSQPEINWFTWGFEGTTLFAARIERAQGGEAVITINGQACKTTTCAMIDELEIRLALNTSGGGETKIDISQLVEEGDLSDVK